MVYEMTNNTWTYKPDRKDMEHEQVMVTLGINSEANTILEYQKQLEIENMRARANACSFRQCGLCYGLLTGTIYPSYYNLWYGYR